MAARHRGLPEPEASAQGEPPEGEAETTLAAIWAELLDTPIGEIRRDTSFFDIGGHSLSAVSLAGRIALVFGRAPSLETILTRPTLAAMAQALQARWRTSQRNVFALQPQGDLLPIFAVHPASGYPLCFLPLARELGPQQPLYGIQASGLDDDEPLPASIEAMAADYIRAIKSVQPHGPWQLLGMSSGGLVAFEMARQMRAAGDDIALLAMLDTTRPQDMPPVAADAPAAQDGIADELLLGLATDTAQERRALIELGRLTGQADRVARVFAHVARLHRSHRPGTWPGAALVVRALRRGEPRDLPPDWAAHVSGALAVHDLDCTHGEIVSSAFAPALAEILRPHLHAAQQHATPDKNKEDPR